MVDCTAAVDPFVPTSLVNCNAEISERVSSRRDSG